MKKSFNYVLATVLLVIAMVLAGCASTAAPGQSNPVTTPTLTGPASTSTATFSQSNPVTTPTSTAPASSPSTTPTQPASSPGGQNISSPAPGQAQSTGKLEVVVTDAPPKNKVTDIVVSLKSIEIHQVANDSTTGDQSVQGTPETTGRTENSSWINIPVNPDDEIHLLETQNNPEVLTTANTVIGNYSQVRMEINYIKVQFDNSKWVDATVPSGVIKFIQPFKVSVTDVTSLLFDFDAAQSLNVTGNGKVIFKPVVKLSVNTSNNSNNNNSNNKNKVPSGT